MYAVLVVEPGILEGIKQDGSFFQHGNQVQEYMNQSLVIFISYFVLCSSIQENMEIM